jgi:hypothetical protein
LLQREGVLMASDPTAVDKIRFYQHLPPRSQMKFLAAVFFMISPFWLLSWSYFQPERRWYEVALLLVCSGLIAVTGALCFLRSPKYLFLAVPAAVVAWLLLSALTEPAFSLEGGLIGLLIFTGYALFLSFLNDEGAKSFALQTQMALAREIHRTLVPPLDRRAGAFEVFGRSTPSGAMGGDLFDFYEEGGRTWLYVADVAGHGIQAGVVMGMIRAAARSQIRTASSPEEVIASLNRLVLELGRPELFVTMACLVFDGKTTARCVVAGHPPILRYRGTHKTLESLQSSHLPLGIAPAARFDFREIECASGDVFALFTDGLTEVTDRDGREFGNGGVETLIAEHAGRGDRELAGICEVVLARVGRFGEQLDDQTLVLAKVL